MSEHLQGSSILLYGVPKVGKTQTVATFPQPIVWYATERGHRYLPDGADKHIIPVYGADQWRPFCDHVRQKKGLQSLKPKTVVIDTLNNLYHSCFQAVCQKEKIAHPADKGKYGQSVWHMIRMDFYGVVADLVGVCAELGATVVFICHADFQDMESRSRSWKRTTYALPMQLREHLPGVVEHIWYLAYTDSEEGAGQARDLHLRGDAYIDADTRDPYVTYPKVRLTNKDGTARNAWKVLSLVFEKSHS